MTKNPSRFLRRWWLGFRRRLRLALLPHNGSTTSNALWCRRLGFQQRSEAEPTVTTTIIIIIKISLW
ncbi:hypothetical protein HanPI659440_Chr10g0387101 [Helianthus annuus]|nr:hypothetical protein HanPI659440_Chr10g0387101 [Helianthus annuus]